GQTKTCTVTNDDIAPKLIVIKHVINDNSSTATASNCTMSVTVSSPSPAISAGTGSPHATVTLNESHYSARRFNTRSSACSVSADCAGSLVIGQTKTCTVTNNDIAPQLIVIKHVINDDSTGLRLPYCKAAGAVGREAGGIAAGTGLGHAVGASVESHGGARRFSAGGGGRRWARTGNVHGEIASNRRPAVVVDRSEERE